MGRLKSIEKKKRPQGTELSQLKEELRRVTEKLESRESEPAEALEQQTVTSEILPVIASSHNDNQPMLDTMIERSRAPCNAINFYGSRSLEVSVEKFGLN